MSRGMDRHGRGQRSRGGIADARWHCGDPGWAPPPDLGTFDDDFHCDLAMKCGEPGLGPDRFTRKRPFDHREPSASDTVRFNRPRYDELFEPLIPDERQMPRARRSEEIQLEVMLQLKSRLLEEENILLLKRERLRRMADEMGGVPPELVIEQRHREEDLLQKIVRIEEDLKIHTLPEAPRMEDDELHLRRVLGEEEFLKERLFEEEQRRIEEGRTCRQRFPDQEEIGGHHEFPAPQTEFMGRQFLGPSLMQPQLPKIEEDELYLRRILGEEEFHKERLYEEEQRRIEEERSRGQRFLDNRPGGQRHDGFRALPADFRGNSKQPPGPQVPVQVKKVNKPQIKSNQGGKKMAKLGQGDEKMQPPKLKSEDHLAPQPGKQLASKSGNKPKKPVLASGKKATLKPKNKPTPQPGNKPTPQPKTQPASRSGNQTAPQPGKQTALTSSSKATLQLVKKPTVQPEKKPTSEPGNKPTVQPSKKPVPQPGILKDIRVQKTQGNPIGRQVLPGDYPTEKPDQPRGYPGDVHVRVLPPGILKDITTQKPEDYSQSGQGLPGKYPAGRPERHRDYPSYMPHGQGLPGDYPHGLPGDYPTHRTLRDIQTREPGYDLCGYQEGLLRDYPPPHRRELAADYPAHKRRLAGNYPPFQEGLSEDQLQHRMGLPADYNQNLSRHQGLINEYSTQGSGLRGDYLQSQSGYDRPLPSTESRCRPSYPGGHYNQPSTIMGNYPGPQPVQYRESYLDQHVALMRERELENLLKKNGSGSNHGNALMGTSLHKARLSASSDSLQTFSPSHGMASDIHKMSLDSDKPFPEMHRSSTFDYHHTLPPRRAQSSMSDYYTAQPRIIMEEEHQRHLVELKEKEIRDDLVIPLQSLVHTIKLNTKITNAMTFKTFLSAQKNVSDVGYYTKHTDPSNHHLTVIACEIYINNVFIANGRVRMPSIAWEDMVAIGVQGMWKSSKIRRLTLNDAYANMFHVLTTTSSNVICNTYKVLLPGQEPDGCFDVSVPGYGRQGNSNRSRLLLMRAALYPMPVNPRIEDIVLWETETPQMGDNNFSMLSKSASLSGLALEWDYKLTQLKSHNSTRCTMKLAGKTISDISAPTREASLKSASKAAIDRLYKTQPVIKILHMGNDEYQRLTWDELQATAQTWMPPEDASTGLTAAVKACVDDVLMETDGQDSRGLDLSLFDEPLLPCNENVVQYIAYWIDAAAKSDNLQEVWIATGLPLAERRAVTKVAHTLGYRLKSETKQSALYLTALRDLTPKEMVACLQRNNGTSGRYTLVTTGNWTFMS